MNKHNGKIAIVPMIGQPVTLLNWAIPVTCALQCNCLIPEGKPSTALNIVAGQSATCPHCKTAYVAFWDPKTSQVAVAMQKPTLQPADGTQN
jgi:hypothetical protein